MDALFTAVYDDAVLSVVWSAATKGAALLALACVAALLLRRKSAALRHLVWTLALSGLLFLPALSLLLPRLELPLLPAEVVVAAPTDPLPAGPGPSVAQTAAPLDVPGVAAIAPAPAPAAEPWHAADALCLAWILGALLAFLPLPLGMLLLHRASRRARPLYGPLIDSAVSALGLHGRVRVLATDAFAMPLATGILRPTILVPIEMETWPEDKRRAVLLHELAHVRRRDCLSHALGRLAVALYWWNPLAWFALARQRSERERACDDLVLSAGSRASEYAEQLLDIARARTLPTLTSAAALTMAHPGPLEGRLCAILDATRNRRALTRRALAAGFVVLIAVTFLLALVHLVRASASLVSNTPFTFTSVPTEHRRAFLTRTQVLDLATGELMERPEDLASEEFLRGGKGDLTYDYEDRPLLIMVRNAQSLWLESVRKPARERQGMKFFPLRISQYDTVIRTTDGMYWNVTLQDSDEEGTKITWQLVPEVFHSSSRRGPERVATPGASRIVLPSGVEVELAEIVKSIDGQTAWNPEGILVAPPAVFDEKSRKWVLKQRRNDGERGFMVRVSHVDGVAPRAEIRCGESVVGSTVTAWVEGKFVRVPVGGMSCESPAADGRSTWHYYQCMPSGVDSATLQVGVAGGPWYTLASARPGEPPRDGKIGENTGTIQSIEWNGETRYAVRYSRNFLSNAWIRLVALDKDGLIRHPIDSDWSKSEKLFIEKFDMPPDQLAEFQLQLSEFQWAVFPDLPLEPSDRTVNSPSASEVE